MDQLVIIYVVAGLVAGILAGLFGVGGGIIIVPILIYTFNLQHIDSSVAVHMAIGTSLACIIFTSINSARSHNKAGSVVWPVLKWLAIGIVIGAVIGSVLASHISGAVLEKIFGGFCFCIAIQMFFNLQPKVSRPMPKSIGLSLGGGVIGLFSAIFGVGGGSLTVPYLNWYGVSMQKAVGTSAVCGLPIALVGAASYAVLGWHDPQLPEWSLGYIYLPATLGIAISSMLTAPIGARLANRLPALVLKRFFAVMLVVIGIKLIA